MEPIHLIPLAITAALLAVTISLGYMHARIQSLKAELRAERSRNEHISRQLDAFEQAEASRQTINDILGGVRPFQKMKRRFPLRQRRRIWGYVYLMCINGEYHKIGYAQNVRSRVSEMQVSSPYQIEILHMISCSHAPRLEIVLQNRFADKWIAGEWFKLDTDDIATIRQIESPVTVADLDRIEGIEEP